MLASALATFNNPDTVGDPNENTLTGVAITIAILGVAVGVFTALNQIFRPSERSVAHHHLRNALLREGWDYVAGRGRYKDELPPAALDLFYDTVNGLHQRVDVIYETPAGPGQ